MALSPQMLKEHFEKAKKCEISGEIKKIEKIDSNNCAYNLKIRIKGTNNDYLLNGIMAKNDCIIDSYNLVFLQDSLNIGDRVNYILDDNYYPLDFDPNTVETNNIKECNGNFMDENNKFEISNNIFYGIIIFLILIICILIFRIYKYKKYVN